MARFTFACPLRWSDTDAYQHVNNAAIATYLEEARVQLHNEMRRNLAEAAPEDTLYVVARQEIVFRRPLTYRPEPVVIEVWITKIAGASFDLAYEIRDDLEVHVTAATALVAFSNTRLRPARITDAERAFLAPLLMEE
jgi:acyl-CoA thioester hydrolase